MSDTANITSVNAYILLMNKELSSLAMVHNLAIKTHKIIRQNITWAIAYNMVAIPLAAMGYVQPWLAAIGMSASSIIVVLNASRLLRGRAA
jgi:Cu2+-exporting ATPase